MPGDHIPRRPLGHVPGKDFVDTHEPYGMKLGVITRVDELNMKADIHIITGGGDRFEIDLTQAMCGQRSFWGGVPEVNSTVIIGYRRKHKKLYEAMILGFIPSGSRLGLRFDPFAPVDPSTIDPEDASNLQQLVGSPYRVKRLKLRPGDVGGMSADGAEFTLTKDVRAYNRAGDFFELRDTDRTWVGSSIHRIENESGVMRISGPIRRGAFYTYPDIIQAPSTMTPTPPSTVIPPTVAGGTTITLPPPAAPQVLIQSAATPGAFAPGATTVGSATASTAQTASELAAIQQQQLQDAQIAAAVAAAAAATYPGLFVAPATPPSISSVTGQPVSTQPPYYGTYVYQAAGPGFMGGPNKFADVNGNLLGVFNNITEFPSTTYSNGRQVYYTNTYPGVNLEDPQSGGGAEAFTEYRIEVDHTSDLTQQVREEIDGFATAPRIPYIEHVLGTTVGNDTTSSAGQRTYNRPVKPKIFDDFSAGWGEGSFTMEEVPRSPLDDLEVFTVAGAYLLAIHPPRAIDDNYFACAVSKQGKIFLNVPGSIVERYPDGTKNVSMEANFLGGIKAYIGAATPSNVSINLTCEGAIVANIGSNSQGQAINVTYHSSVVTSYQGTPDDDDAAYTENIQGLKQIFCSGISTENVAGQKTTTVNGGYQIFTDRLAVQCNSGYSLSVSDYSATVGGKTQSNYALAVVENIVAGGKVSTILAGALVTTVAAGAILTTAGAGAMTDTVGGAFTMTAGGAASYTAGGAISQSAGGAISQTAGAAVTVTAALAATMTSGVAASLVAPQCLLGGPAAVLGIARGLPMMPPGSPSLDWITGLPLQGSAVSRSY